MTTQELPVFGVVSLVDGEWFSESTVEIGGREVEVDLNATTETFPTTTALALLKMLEDLEMLDSQGRRAILSRPKQEGICWVDAYLDHLVTECSSSELKAIFKSEAAPITVEKLVKALQLERIGVYPDMLTGAIPHIVMDYTPGVEFTDSLLVVKLDRNSGVLEVVTES